MSENWDESDVNNKAASSAVKNTNFDCGNWDDGGSNANFGSSRNANTFNSNSGDDVWGGGNNAGNKADSSGRSFGKGRGFLKKLDDNYNDGLDNSGSSRGNNYNNDRYNSGSGRGNNYNDRYNSGSGRGNNYNDDRNNAGSGRGNNYNDRYNSGSGRGNNYNNDRYNSGSGRGNNYNDDRNNAGSGRGNNYNNDRYDSGSGRGNNYNDDRSNAGSNRGNNYTSALDGDKSYGSSKTFFNSNSRRSGGNDEMNNRNDGGGKFGNKFKSADDDNDENAGKDKEGEPERTPVTYIPPKIEQLSVEEMITDGNAFADYDYIEVKCSGAHVPRPLQGFEDAGFDAEFYKSISTLYKKPTPIQKYGIPCIMAGRDIMACSQTGSGKTAAFMFPILDQLIKSNDKVICNYGRTQPYVLVIAPTRELVIQITQTSLTFARHVGIKIEVLYGGTAVHHQRKQILGSHVLVATVGRLIHFLDRGYIAFSSLKFLVLDEADRMLDMGFKPDIDKIVAHESMPKQIQTVMFSATFSDDVQRLAANFLTDYIFITVGVVGGACKDVEQNFYLVPKTEKRKKIVELIEQEKSNGILVFVETKKNADYLASVLSRAKFPTTSIHGDRFQEQREEALSEFRRGKRGVLVATSVAARGLDIKGVRHVINYDLPKDIDEYVHRIGRTGRVGNYGKATSFYDPAQDSNLVGDLVRILRQAEQNIPEWLASSQKVFDNEGENFGAYDYRKDVQQADTGYADWEASTSTTTNNNIDNNVEDEW